MGCLCHPKIEQDEMKVAPLGVKIKSNSLLYRINRNSIQLQNKHNSLRVCCCEIRLSRIIQPANSSAFPAFPIWIIPPGDGVHWQTQLVGMIQADKQSPWPPVPPVRRLDFYAIMS